MSLATTKADEGIPIVATGEIACACAFNYQSLDFLRKLVCQMMHTRMFVSIQTYIVLIVILCKSFEMLPG
jgi:hypothetical protein